MYFFNVLGLLRATCGRAHGEAYYQIRQFSEGPITEARYLQLFDSHYQRGVGLWVWVSRIVGVT